MLSRAWIWRVAFHGVVTRLPPTSRHSSPAPGGPTPRTGDEISICGRHFHTGAKVVLWNDPHGFDAYRTHSGPPRDAPDRLVRYGSSRRAQPPGDGAPGRSSGWEVSELAEVVTQVVLHYDAAGTSRKCFEILHEVRGLSCHFLLDLDGIIYQTLDVMERAWHAGIANARSVGIEIANIGAYPAERTLATRHRRTYPDRPVPPAHSPVRGNVQGADLVQYPFTDEQYDALGKLVAALCRVLDIPAAAPRDPDGGIRSAVLESEQAIRDFEGILGHFHVYAEKVDPGPAFDWDRLFRALAGYGVR